MWIERNGPSWRIRDLVGGKKVTIRAGYQTKTAAAQALTLLRGDALRGEALMPRGGEITLAEWVEMWWPLYAPTLKPSSKRSEGSRVRIHIVPALGHLRLDEITPLVLMRWVAALSMGEPDAADATRWVARPLSPKTVRNVHGVLHKVLAAAVLDRRIKTNPAADTPMPAKRRKEMRFLTPPEIDRLLAACPGHWRPLVLVLVSTGLRYGEAIGLKAGRLDVLAHTLRVEEAMHEAGKGEYVFTEPKSEQSRRTVSFPAEVAAELVALVVDKGRDDLVFAMPDGRPVTRNFRQRTWVEIRDAAGLPGLRLHDLRHTFAALLITAGVSLTVVQRMMGHSSIRVTSDLYGHLSQEAVDGAVAAVSAALPKIESRGAVGESAGDQLRVTARGDA